MSHAKVRRETWAAPAGPRHATPRDLRITGKDPQRRYAGRGVWSVPCAAPSGADPAPGRQSLHAELSLDVLDAGPVTGGAQKQADTASSRVTFPKARSATAFQSRVFSAVNCFSPPYSDHHRQYGGSVTPIVRTASATDFPCATRASAWRSFATISSGVLACFLAVPEPPDAAAGLHYWRTALRGQLSRRPDPARAGYRCTSKARPNTISGRNGIASSTVRTYYGSVIHRLEQACPRPMPTLSRVSAVP
jgi:hypothetical protein